MTEPPSEGRPEDYASFAFMTRNQVRVLRIRYQGCTVSFSFANTDEGIKSAHNLAESFMKIWTAALTEQGVLDAMDGLDDELNELLGGDDADE